MKVLVIGHSSYDISCPVDEYPVENTKYRLSENVMCGGGPAGNAAYLLGKWGVDTYYAGVVGSDDFGSKIKKEFESIGVHTEYLETNYEKPTSISFIMINKKNGSRTLFNIAGERPSLKKYDFTIDPDIILYDGHEYQASQYAINKYPNAISVIDAGRITPELLELCKYSKYIVASKGFAETVTKIKIDYANPNSLVQVYTALKNKYQKSEIVVTLEDKGALYAVNNEIKIMPGLKVTPVDTTGAGDIFHGAFVYALSKGFDIEKCVRYANITAGLSCQKLGARLSIPSYTEVSNYYNEKFPTVAQPTPEVNQNVAPVQMQAPVQQPSVQTQTPSVEQPQISASIPNAPAQDVQRVTLSQAMEQNRAQQNVNQVNIQAPQGIADATTVIPIVNPDNGATTPNTNVGIAEQIQQNNINNIQG